MEGKIASFKAKYERFMKNGGEDPLALKTEAERLIAEAKTRGNKSLVEELEEILMELALSVEETKCHCHMGSRCCKC